MRFELGKSRYMQYVSAVAATMSMSAAVAHISWPSPSLPKLQSADSPIGTQVTNDEGSWIVSMYSLAVLPASFFAGWLIERYGRKKSLLIGGLLLFIPWFMIIFANHIAWLYIARAIAGTGGSTITIACAMYTGEIAEKDIRGKLTTTFILWKQLGTIVVLTMGPYVSYRWLGIISLIFPCLFIAVFAFMPESPYYYMKNGDKANAERIVRILSSNEVDDKFIGNRLNEIESTIKEDMENKTTLWEFLSNPEYRKSILIMTGLKTLQMLSGLPAIDAYLESIIKLTSSSISSELSSIIFGIVQLPAVLIASFLVDKFGRKPLIIISTLGCAIALAGEGLYFYLQDETDTDVSSLAWLPTTALALYLIMAPLGITTVIFVILGEIFPSNIKGIAISAFTVYGGSLSFLVSKFFAPIAKAWGTHSVFWIFGAICLSGAIFTQFCLPETKGRTLAEIQTILRGNVKERIDERNYQKETC